MSNLLLWLVYKNMNERIRELAEQAYQEQDPELLTNASRTFEHGIWLSGYSKKFAELIVKDVTNLLRQEWFNENNDKEETDKREIAIRLGKKLAYMKSVDLITERYGVEL